MIRATVVLALFAACLASQLNAETVILQQGLDGYPGTTDTSIFEDYPANSAGSFPYVFAGVNQAGNVRRTLIKFDMAGFIPATATVTTASLEFYTDFGRPGKRPAEIHKMTLAWHEGETLSTDPMTIGQGAAAETGDSTWTYVSFSAVPWTTPGGDFDPAPSASGISGENNTWLILTGDRLVQDIQAWLTSPAENHGWVLMVNETVAHNAKRYFSSESPAGDELLRPRLRIEFENPSGIQDWTLF